ncbi:MAG: DEAD/DEAH box helicase [Crenarchaeota archaeon]|nr:DEAD/DEAH box helicase [Thermoproteota archaeon]
MHDPLLEELSILIKRAWSGAGAGIRHVYVEETGEPEPGPGIEDLDLPEPVIEALRNRGIRRLYRFQYEAIKKIMDGYNVVIVAGTGTGKTEAFLIPLIKLGLETRMKPVSLLLYPTKALARDQLARIHGVLGFGGVTAAVYDGDTPSKERRRISREPPHILVTNPDMIHVGLVLSNPIRSFIRSARIMVFDELHVYEGVLGAHVRAIIERIKRHRRGRTPQFIGVSATIGNPKEHAEALFSSPVEVVEGPRRRKGTAYHVLVSAGKLSRWTVAAGLASMLIDLGLRVLVFTDSQQMAELVARIAKSYGKQLLVHRAGLKPEDRRAVEHKLRTGEAQGVVATPTLELGIDIGYLDAVVMVAPPPSFAKYLQRAGRAGRRGRTGYIFTILSDDPIDAYYERNPERFYNQEIPPSYLEPDNEEVLKIHGLALLLQERVVFGRYLRDPWRRALDSLVYERLAVKIADRYIVNWRPAFKIFRENYMSIRGAGPQVRIIDRETGEVIGYRELPQAILDLHKDAIYLCSGKIYESLGIDPVKRVAYVRRLPDDTPYYTRPLYSVDVVDYDIIMERTTSRGIPLAYARAALKIVVEGYVLRNYYEAGKKGIKNWLDEPVSYSYVTRAVFAKYPVNEEWDWMSNAEAFHAIEHAVISAARPVCGAGLGDMGGISYPSGDIVFYDAAPGGSGLARLLYDRYEKAEDIAYEIMARCDCLDGCPRCIYSPYCGNNNQVLSRTKALYMLGLVRKNKYRLPAPLEDRYGKAIV